MQNPGNEEEIEAMEEIEREQALAAESELEVKDAFWYYAADPSLFDDLAEGYLDDPEDD